MLMAISSKAIKVKHGELLARQASHSTSMISLSILLLTSSAKPCHEIMDEPSFRVDYSALLSLPDKLEDCHDMTYNIFYIMAPL